MATENALKSIPYTASVDLSAAQYTFVAVSGEDAVGLPADNGGDAIGIVQNNPVVGCAAAVAVTGQSKILFGAAGLAAGAKVTCDATGKAVAVVAGDTILGTVVQGGGAGIIGAIVLSNEGVSA